MRKTMLGACVALAACASGGSGVTSAPAAVEQTTRITSDAGTAELRTTRSDPTAAFAIAAPPERVFRALSSVYEELGLTVNVLDTQGRRIGVENGRIRRQLGGQRLSRYLECGERLGGRVAETDDISFTLLTQVTADGQNSTLRTLVDATARPIGVSGNPITCATTGNLEERIVALVREAVAR
jgi:hypothetical protein